MAQKFVPVALLAGKVVALQAVAVHVKKLFAALALVIEDVFEVRRAEHPAPRHSPVKSSLGHHKILPGDILLCDLPE